MPETRGADITVRERTKDEPGGEPDQSFGSITTY